jgi:predicted dehydrogenase
MAAGAKDDTAISLYGSRGSAHLDTHQPESARFYNLDRQQWIEGVLSSAGERTIELLWPPHKQSQGMMGDAHLACAYDFLQTVAGGKRSPIDFAHALKTQEVLEAAYRSAAQGGERVEIIHE